MSEPTELEKQLHQALAVVIDEFDVPLEITKGGLTVCRFSPEQVDEIRHAYGLFSLIHDLKLSMGEYVSTEQDRKNELWRDKGSPVPPW